MIRVTKRKHCPVCQKPDWCLISEDGSAAICTRIEEGSVKRCGDAGWLHILRDDKHLKARTYSWRICDGASDTEEKDFRQWADKYQQQLTDDNLNKLSVSLGVSETSLRRLHVGWDGQAFTFPMQDDNGKILGIRRRFPSGSKVSIKGSKTGLFICTGLDESRPLLICEGPTDTAAALDLGFDAIGRPNCNSKVLMTAKAAKGRSEIVIVGDSDDVGQAGAENLADALALYYKSVKIVYPPKGIKDLRKLLQAGLTHETLQQIIKETRSVELTICFKD